MEALNILVVEDDAIVAELLADMLVELGRIDFVIEASEDGTNAAAARYKPD